MAIWSYSLILVFVRIDSPFFRLSFSFSFFNCLPRIYFQTVKYLKLFGNWAKIASSLQLHLKLTNQTERELGPFEVSLLQNGLREEKVIMINGLKTMVKHLDY